MLPKNYRFGNILEVSEHSMILSWYGMYVSKFVIPYSMGFKLLNWPCSLEFGAPDCKFPKHANDSFDFHATNRFLS